MYVPFFILLLFALLFALFTYINRRNKAPEDTTKHDETSANCCGAHENCDRNTLLDTNDKIVYYDDEELDLLKATEPSQFTKEQIEQLSEVFYTLKESDVAGWLVSLQKRDIQLPDFLLEEALMIVRERREH